MALNPARRPHIHALDRLRIITAISVVGVHVFAMTTFLDHTQFALEVQNGFVTALHFTREVFLFVTALALVYVYYDKPPTFRSFWRKRSIGVLFPYAVWSAIYVWINPHPAAALPLSATYLWDLVTGAASYQLYYILLTLEFYLLLPWFLRFLRRANRHPWVTLSVSFALEVLLLFVSYYHLQASELPPALQTPVTIFVGRFILFYQFYFVLGGIVALHIRDVQAFVLRHGRLMVLAGIAALALIEGHFYYETLIQGQGIAEAVLVLQPVMAFYSIGAIAFLYWLAYQGTAKAQKTGAKGQRNTWRDLSDASFGIYLAHPLFLGATEKFVLPHLQAWPAIAQVFLAWLLTAAGSLALSLLLLRLPYLSRLVGRSGPSWNTFVAGLRGTREARSPQESGTAPSLSIVGETTNGHTGAADQRLISVSQISGQNLGIEGQAVTTTAEADEQ